MHPFLAHIQYALHHHHHRRRAAWNDRRGFAGFGGRHGFSSGPTGVGFDGLNRGRKLGSADLQLLLLALLADRPSHGYELIKALDDRSRGYYVPSPGMVYPALTYLEEIGHASVEPQGTRKLYRPTDTGRAELERRRDEADALLRQLGQLGERMDELRRAMAGRGPEADGADLGEPDRGRGRFGGPELRAARRSLKAALIEKAAAGEAEHRRIAVILERAAAEIRNVPPTAA